MEKEQIRRWLVRENHTRQWLAQKCGVAVKTLNNWLGSERAVPQKALRVIEKLMEDDKASDREAKPRLVLEFTKDEFEMIGATALKEGMTITQWAESKLRLLCDCDLEQVNRALKNSGRTDQ